MMHKDLNVSIVLYNSEFTEINTLVTKLKSSVFVNEVYLVDNSPNKLNIFESCDAKYIFTGKNLGYGRAHNLAINESINRKVKYHIVLNSDIFFDISILEDLFKMMQFDAEIGMLMPKVLNHDGTLQVLPKLLPTPFNLFIRVFPLLGHIFHSMNDKYTLKKYSNIQLNVPLLSGCFSFFRVSALMEIGLYDDNFIMYFEDFDISRRMHLKYKTIYYPSVSIIHAHERGAAKSFRLFVVFVKSAIRYFNKYGWFFDFERRRINKCVLKSLK